MNREYFHSLDGIRGLLALTVAFFHVQWAGLFTSNAFVQNGYLAVDFFFCLSGFLMFRLYGNMRSIDDTKSFMIRRFVRIYPLHLFTLMAFVAYLTLRLVIHKLGIPIMEPGEALPFSSDSAENTASFLSNIFLTQSLGVDKGLSFNGPAWSISAEFYTYIIFAALTIVAPIKTRLHILYVFVFSMAAYAFLAFNKPNLDVTYDLGLVRCLAGFAIGIIASWILDLDRSTETKRSKSESTLLEVLVLISAVYWVANAEGLMTFTIAPVLLSVMLIFAKGQGHISSFLSQSVFRYLGKISYSVYLNHALIIIAFQIILNKLFGDVSQISYAMGTLISVAYLMVVIISSHITYNWVEKPAMKWMSRFQKKRALHARVQSWQTNS